MRIRETSLPGLLVIEPQVHGDARGWFVETFQRDRYREAGIAIDQDFVQDNLSSSIHNTLRGMHYRARQPQAKLVWVSRGTIFDVAVDLRRGSPAFGSWFALELSAENHHQLWIPAGFAHGFLVVSDVADVQYKTTSYYEPDDERVVAWNDPDLAIPWPLRGEPIVSARDRDAPALRQAELPA